MREHNALHFFCGHLEMQHYGSGVNHLGCVVAYYLYSKYFMGARIGYYLYKTLAGSCGQRTPISSEIESSYADFAQLGCRFFSKAYAGYLGKE